jgi:hypothetical protein
MRAFGRGRETLSFEFVGKLAELVAIDGFLERDALFARTLLQEARKVIVDGERGAHSKHHGCYAI